MQIDQNKKKIKKGLTRGAGVCYYNQAVAFRQGRKIL